jgi:hypothetical protein
MISQGAQVGIGGLAALAIFAKRAVKRILIFMKLVKMIKIS